MTKHNKKLPEIGDKFGKLEIIGKVKYEYKWGRNIPFVKVRCKCKKKTVKKVKLCHLLGGITLSCGCLKKGCQKRKLTKEDQEKLLKWFDNLIEGKISIYEIAKRLKKRKSTISVFYSRKKLLRRKAREIHIGDQFDCLTVISEPYIGPRGEMNPQLQYKCVMVKCNCDKNIEKEVILNSLIVGNCRSCGHLIVENNPNKYTEKEIEFIKANYKIKTDKEIAEELERTEKGILSFRKRHNLLKKI